MKINIYKYCYEDLANMDSWPDEQRLLVTLLHDYEPASRPVYNASTPVNVKFGLTLTQIFDMVSAVKMRRT